MTDPIGSVKFRIGPKEQEQRKKKQDPLFTVNLTPDKDAALNKLKFLKDVKKDEVINLGLDLILQHCPDDIAAIIRERRDMV